MRPAESGVAGRDVGASLPRLRCVGVYMFWNTRTEARMGATTIVVRRPLAENVSEMALVERHHMVRHSRRTVPINSAVTAIELA